MKNLDLSRIVACIALAATLGLPAGAANAFVDYTSFFDPPDFEGTSGFRIAKTCLAGADGYRYLTSPECAPNFKWTAASVTLKNDDGASKMFDYPVLGAIQYIYVVGNQLAGVNSDPTTPVAISNDPTAEFNGEWTLKYNFPPPDQQILSLGTVSLCDADQECSLANVQDFTPIGPNAVPEPGTLGLTLGAIGMAWFVRRRKTG